MAKGAECLRRKKRGCAQEVIRGLHVLLCVVSALVPKLHGSPQHLNPPHRAAALVDSKKLAAKLWNHEQRLDQGTHSEHCQLERGRERHEWGN